MSIKLEENCIKLQGEATFVYRPTRTGPTTYIHGITLQEVSLFIKSQKFQKIMRTLNCKTQKKTET